MNGYESIGPSNSIMGIWAFIAIAIVVLVYKFCTAIDGYSLDNIYVLPEQNKGPIFPKTVKKKVPKPPKKIGKTMQCRRYRVVNGKLTVYYTEEATGAVDYPGYYAGTHAAALDANAPIGTTYVYLDCKRSWGYSEKMPSPECCMFGSKEMLELADMYEAGQTEAHLDELERVFNEGKASTPK